MKYGISTTAIALGRPLGDVLWDALPIVGRDGVIEIAIGPRPVNDAWAVLKALPATIELRAHHSVPLGGMSSSLRPESDMHLRALPNILRGMGIYHYSMHPRSRDDCDFLHFHLNVARDFASWGVEFAVETMFPTRKWEFHMFEQFKDAAVFWESNGWKYPLVLDLAHLQIGLKSTALSETDIRRLLDSDWYREVHFSSNDGVSDQHRQYDPARDENILRWLTMVHPDAVLIDEGRRRR